MSDATEIIQRGRGFLTFHTVMGATADAKTCLEVIEELLGALEAAGNDIAERLKAERDEASNAVAQWKAEYSLLSEKYNVSRARVVELSEHARCLQQDVWETEIQRDERITLAQAAEIALEIGKAAEQFDRAKAMTRFWTPDPISGEISLFAGDEARDTARRIAHHGINALRMLGYECVERTMMNGNVHVALHVGETLTALEGGEDAR